MNNYKIKSIGYYIPSSVSIVNAIKKELYSHRDAQITKYKRICIENIFFPPEMAKNAVNNLVKNKSFNDIKSLFYTYIHYQGQHDFWSPSSFLANEMGLSPELATYNLKQGCNGLFIALNHIVNNNLTENSLLVSADRFNTTNFNRWNSDYHIVYGDGACALHIVKNDDQSDFEILDSNLTNSYKLEGLHRTANFKYLDDNTFNVKPLKKGFLRLYGTDLLKSETNNAMDYLINSLINKGLIDFNEPLTLLTPNLGDSLIKDNYLESFKLFKNLNHPELGLNLGHLGCSDVFIKLSILNEQKAIKKDEKILLIGAGAGFNWSSILLKKL